MQTTIFFGKRNARDGEIFRASSDRVKCAMPILLCTWPFRLLRSLPERKKHLKSSLDGGQPETKNNSRWWSGRTAAREIPARDVDSDVDYDLLPPVWA